jgi:hypothetical protein
VRVRKVGFGDVGGWEFDGEVAEDSVPRGDSAADVIDDDVMAGGGFETMIDQRSEDFAR